MTRKETAVPDAPEAPPTPAEPAPIPSSPACGACGTEAVVNWRRRPTDDELAQHVALEQSRRDERLALADPQLPPPVFPPLPTADDTTTTVYSCGPHAITMDAAALIHAGSCSAPNETGANGCDCTPEEPVSAPPLEASPSRLPQHWATGSA